MNNARAILTGPIAIAAAGLLYVAESAHAQIDDPPPVIYPTVPESGAQPDDFVPQGWGLVKRLEGAISRDGQQGVVLILRMQDPKNVVKDDSESFAFNSNPWMLVGALRTPGRPAYRRIFQDNEVIPRLELPGSSGFEAAELKNGKLTVTLYHGSSVAVVSDYTFEYQRSCFRLVGLARYAIHRATHEEFSGSINFLTSKSKVQATRDEGSRASSPTWLRLTNQKRWCLGALAGLDDEVERALTR